MKFSDNYSYVMHADCGNRNASATFSELRKWVFWADDWTGRPQRYATRFVFAVRRADRDPLKCFQGRLMTSLDLVQYSHSFAHVLPAFMPFCQCTYFESLAHMVIADVCVQFCAATAVAIARCCWMLTLHILYESVVDDVAVLSV